MLSDGRQKLQDKSGSAELRKKAGTWLRSMRCELGLSQRELARRVNMDFYTFISQIESGRGRIPADRLRDWSEALEVDPKEFAINLMQYYDPHSFDMIYGSEDLVK
jgi:transcriptional regulator with XRE-family HTH domain